MSHVRPEHRLLALALPVTEDGASREIAPLCGGPMDWSYLLEAGRQVGALPLLGAALQSAGAVAPPEVTAACQEAFTRCVMRSLVAARTLRELQGALDGAGVPFLILKGMPLAYEVYEHPGLRPIGDLDLLVPPRAVDAALEALRGRGYHPPRTSLSVTFFRRHHFHLTLVKEGHEGIPVELHWDTQPFFSLSRIPEREFWARPRVLTMEGLQVMVPGREESFMFLAQHMMRHLLYFGPESWEDPVGAMLEPARRGRLAWIADLALLARCGLDWDQIERLSRRWGIDREITGLREYLALRGVWPRLPGVSIRHPRAGRQGGEVVRRAGALFPVLSRSTVALQMRPILALRLFSFAFPGADWIRWRYELGIGAGRARVLWRAGRHATETLVRAVRLAAAIVAERIRPPTHPVTRARPADRSGASLAF